MMLQRFKYLIITLLMIFSTHANSAVIQGYIVSLNYSPVTENGQTFRKYTVRIRTKSSSNKPARLLTANVLVEIDSLLEISIKKARDTHEFCQFVISKKSFRHILHDIYFLEISDTEAGININYNTSIYNDKKVYIKNSIEEKNGFSSGNNGIQIGD